MTTTEDKKPETVPDDILKTAWASLRSSVCSMIIHTGELDDPYVVIGRKSFTRKQLADEVLNGTEVGIDVMKNMVELTIDLVKRGKEKLKSATSPNCQICSRIIEEEAHHCEITDCPHK